MAFVAFSRKAWLKSLVVMIMTTCLVLFMFEFGTPDHEQLASWIPPLPQNPFVPLPEPDCTSFDPISFQSLASSYRMADNVTYFRRHLRTHRDLVSPPPTVQVKHPLLTLQAATIVNASTGEAYAPLQCSPALEVPISSSKPSGTADLTRFIFGISTTLDRLDASLPHFVRYLTKPQSVSDSSRVTNGAGLVILLHNTTKAQNREAQEKMERSGIVATVKSAVLEWSMPERYFSLVQVLYDESQLSRHDPVWLVLLDDDTFFPHPQQLVHTLKAFKNVTSKELFLGGQREVVSDRSEGYTQLQGGAGIFLSKPMARLLLAPGPSGTGGGHEKGTAEYNEFTGTGKTKNPGPSIWERCFEEDHEEAMGDIRLSKCVQRHTHVKITDLSGLHQQDMFGDPSGFYESGKSMLTMHHWRSWHLLNPSKLSSIGDVCGEDCVLQRWVFASNENGQSDSAHILPPIILTNGYSMVEYLQGVYFDWDLAENTFDQFMDHSVADMDYGIGELREKVPLKEKKSWMFLDSVAVEGGGMRQWYGWRNERDEIASLAELVWLP